MNEFQGILRYEFLMQIRRKVLWVGMAAPFILMSLPDFLRPDRVRIDDGYALPTFSTLLQIFVPIVAGFFLSDRLYRDGQLLTSEWVSVSNATKREYIWGKYLGTVTATLLVVLVYWILSAAVKYAVGIYSVNMIGYAFLAFCLMAVPAYLFIGAYSIAVPSAMSLRLYQILFTCYWLWAHQQLVPSVTGTPLAPGGQFAMYTLLNSLGIVMPGYDNRVGYGPFGWTFEYSPAMTVLNIALLMLLAVMALLVVERYLVWKQEQSV